MGTKHEGCETKAKNSKQDSLIILERDNKILPLTRINRTRNEPNRFLPC
jgi:hypothetical protein